MSYYLYLDGTLFPVTPSKIETKIKGRNKTLTLINDSEVNFLKDAGLTEITFDLLLPNVDYPFATYLSKTVKKKDGIYSQKVFKKADWYLDKLEALKIGKKPFRFIVTRRIGTRGSSLYETNIKVTLEEYTIKEDVKQGFDVVVSVKLKQYRDFGTKIYKIVSGTASSQTTRSTETAPNVKSYTVVAGDTLWGIAKRFYGDGSKYTKIYEVNKSVIGGSTSMIYAGQVLTIPDPTQDIPTSSSGGGSSSGGSSNNVASASISGKVRVKVNGLGQYRHSNVIVVWYVKDGKGYSASTTESTTSLTVQADKGSKVVIVPKPKSKNHKWTFVCSDGSVVWEDQISMGVTEKQAVVTKNVGVDIIWTFESTQGGGRV